MNRIYLDYNATAPCSLDANLLIDVLSSPLNPSSLHWHGRAARNLLEKAREKLLSAVEADRREYSLIFTSSGTEANNLVVNSFKKKHVFSSAIEHQSISKIPYVRHLVVNAEGILDLKNLEEAISDAKGGLLCVMLANNETGVLQPVKDIASIAHKHGIFIHSDCIQGFGKLPVNIRDLGMDSISISAHKIGALPGIGALIYKNSLPLLPAIFGGGQEMGLRAGTENLFHANLFGKISDNVAQLIKEYQTKVAHLRDYLEQQVLSYEPNAKIWSRSVNRLPNTSCILMPGVPAQIQVMRFDLLGFAVSAGSACSSGLVAESHVLKAMGIKQEESTCSIRVSLGPANTIEEVRSFVSAWKEIYSDLRSATQ